MSLAFPRSKPPAVRRQQGAALIMALMVVVMVTLLATTIGSDFLVTYKRVENQLHANQAKAYMRGAEGLARQVLQKDLEDKPAKDHISEGWLNVAQEYPMDQGAISATLCDLQGRFNINSLLLPRPSPASYSPDQEMFIRLLQTLELDPPIDLAQAEDITNAVVDWIDGDSKISSTGGAEDGYYSDLELPYLAGNWPLQSTSELRWVKGVSDELYRALEPHIIALESKQGVNVNTASVNVIRSFNTAGELLPINLVDAERIVFDRDGEPDADVEAMNSGFEAVADFISAHPATALKMSNATVTSEVFLLDASALFMDRKFKLYSVIHRDPSSAKIKTIARGQSGLGRCPETGS